MLLFTEDQPGQAMGVTCSRLPGSGAELGPDLSVLGPISGVFLSAVCPGPGEEWGWGKNKGIEGAEQSLAADGRP